MKLTVQGIHKSFGEKQVLKDISFSAESGKALGLLGRNGAGKTTTIRIIMGVIPANEGQVLLDGVPIDRNKVRIGYLPEERGMYPKQKVLEQLIYFGQLTGMSKQAAKDSAIKLIARLGMTEYTNMKLDALSKGNQQKIQLVATLISDPEIVILDEPFSGLDPVNAQLLKDLVVELIGQGKIVLFSSHQMSYVEEFCDNIAIVNQGQIVVGGNLREVKRSYDRDKIVVFSSSALNEIGTYCNHELKDLIVDTRQHKDHLVVKLKDASYKNKFMAALAQTEFDIDQMNVYEPSLNDIFVEYTEGQV